MNNLKNEVNAAAEMLIKAYRNGGKLLICGNGGSASDSEHIAGELLKGFEKKRPLPAELKSKLPEFGERLQMGLPAISLVSCGSIISAVANDQGADLVYAQQVMALGNPGDVIIGISTSGNAENVVNALLTAGARGLNTIALTGEADSKMSEIASLTLRAPSNLTPDIQEYHIKYYHEICRIVEAVFFTV